VKTEPNMQLSLFLLQIVKIEKDNRIRTTVNCSIYFEHFVIGLICLSTYVALISSSGGSVRNGGNGVGSGGSITQQPRLMRKSIVWRLFS